MADRSTGVGSDTKQYHDSIDDEYGRLYCKEHEETPLASMGCSGCRGKRIEKEMKTLAVAPTTSSSSSSSSSSSVEVEVEVEVDSKRNFMFSTPWIMAFLQRERVKLKCVQLIHMAIIPGAGGTLSEHSMSAITYNEGKTVVYLPPPIHNER
jgi:hypothetical protein